MISFRYHIVSIVSVFLALAVGVALGGGPLRGEVDDTLVEQVEADRRAKAELRAQIAGLRTADEFTDAFAENVAPGLIGGTLDGRTVTLMVLPSATEASVGSVTALVAGAGGEVGGTVRVGDGLLDVGNKQLVDELASQLLDGTPDVSVAEDASGYERMGALLARAIGTEEDGGAEVDEAANSILSGLSTAGLLSPDGELSRRGGLVLVLAGEPTGTPDEQQGASSIMASLLKAVDAGTDGVVVGGPASSARGDGLVNAVRRDVVAAREISTVDVLDQAAGRVVAVMGLSEQAGGGAGHYGAIDAADGVMPGAVPAE